MVVTSRRGLGEVLVTSSVPTEVTPIIVTISLLAVFLCPSSMSPASPSAEVIFSWDSTS